MFKIQEIREMIKLVDNSAIEVLEIEEGDSRISIFRNVGTSQTVPQQINSSKNQTSNTVTDTTTEIPSKQEISKVQVQVAATSETLTEVHNLAKNEELKNLSKIVSPMVGTFYRAPAEDAPPFVKAGDKVDKPTVVCILEAMKLFNEIEAEMEGEIVEVLVENGQLVEHGQPLFLVKQT
ncbi:acetyl-CoA carboxylase biotin carboxyl carrier protein [Neobacillus sp. NRS-1170]|uniref:acetyl-CoA carboxylase biotin carboxyl carrier protein n=1 Tax=Neobacillus sp. NRS-1170 TaxID=3233898 RepID=UPI003D2CA351